MAFATKSIDAVHLRNKSRWWRMPPPVETKPGSDGDGVEIRVTLDCRAA